MVKDRFACFYKSWIKRNAPPRVPPRVKIRGTKEYAGMVELVDSVDLGDVTLVKVLKKVSIMKMTCYNCKNHVDTLIDPTNPKFHIHNWCKQWHRQLDAYALAGQFEYKGAFCDDLETGDAFCYMFAPVDIPTEPDEWFERNKQQNLDSIISE